MQTAENVNLTHKLAQSVVDENETDLRDKYNTVLSLLVYKSDKKALSDLIAEAKKLDKDHYTIETWQNFEKALENAESIYDGNVPQDEVDLAKEALEKAKNVPCVFNNWAVFYKGRFQTVNLLLDINSLARILKK